LRIKLETTGKKKKRHVKSTKYVRRRHSHTSECHRVDVLPIIRERHIGLTEADGVLAPRNTIVNLKLLLGDALRER
jgi:hypothetical protein